MDEFLRQRFLARIEALARGRAVFRALAERRELGRHVIDLLLDGRIPFALALHGLLDGDDFRLHALFFRFRSALRRFRCGLFVFRLFALLFRLPPRVRERDVALGEARQAILLIFRLEGLIRARLLGAHGERAELRLDFLLDVADAHEVRFRVVELFERLALARLVFRDACRLLEKRAALFGAAVQDVVDAVLPDDAHALVADAGVCKQLVDILDAAARPVEEHLALAAAIQAARDDDFGKIDRQRAVRIVEHERDFGDADPLARGRAGENDVFRFRSAQVPHILLAEHPTNRIGDVALAAAVRPDDGRDARIELDDDLVGKRFEAIGFETFQLHVSNTNSLFLVEMLFEFRRARIFAHEFHEAVVDGGKRLVRTPVQ